MALTAGAPLPRLVDALDRAGWGDLGHPSCRGLGSVLLALAAELDPRSGSGRTTAPQLAARTRFTERWVRRCLELLEDLDVIEWSRGGIVAGKPTPSWIRVCKRTVLDLVHVARGQKDERLQAQRVATRARVARLRTSYTQRPGRRVLDRKRPRRDRGEAHAELATALPPHGEVSSAHGPSREATGAQETDKKDDAPASTHSARTALDRIRADLAARRGHGRGEKRSNEKAGAGRGVGARRAYHM